MLPPVLPLTLPAAVVGYTAATAHAAAAIDKLQLQWTRQLDAGWVVAGTRERHAGKGQA